MTCFKYFLQLDDRNLYSILVVILVLKWNFEDQLQGKT
jgi:hypothetical protein